MITFPNSIFAAMRYKVGFFFQEATLSDAVNLSNPAPVLTIGLRPFETVTLSDPLTINYTKALTETIQLTDTISLLFDGGVIFSETVAVGSTGLLLIQDYCDFSYFELDYVGISSTF